MVSDTAITGGAWLFTWNATDNTAVSTTSFITNPENSEWKLNSEYFKIAKCKLCGDEDILEIYEYCKACKWLLGRDDEDRIWRADTLLTTTAVNTIVTNIGQFQVV